MDIVCTGDLMVECMVQVPSLPPRNTTLVLDSISQQLGGPPFNICWYLALLGLNPRLVSFFGQHNKMLLDEAFSETSLDRAGLIPIAGDSDFLFAMLTGSYHHSMYICANLPEGVEREIVSRCGSPKWLIITGSRHAVIRQGQMALAENFKGELLAFNPSYAIFEYIKSELTYFLSRAQVTILNEQESEHACRILSLKGYDELSNCGSGILIITLGKRGVRIYEQGHRIELTAHGVASSGSTIGAGDAFFAGFLFERFHKVPLLEAARFGLIMASHVVMQSQIRVNVSEDQIRRQLAEFDGRRC